MTCEPEIEHGYVQSIQPAPTGTVGTIACNDGYVLSTDMYREVECVLIEEEPMWNITDMTPTCIPGIFILII